MRRRNFLKRTSPLLATPLLLNGMRVGAKTTPNHLYASVAAGMPTDRVLLVIQLEGGNDGLNTLVPVEDDLYYTMRPNLAIPKEEALGLDGLNTLRMHPEMGGMAQLFNEGSMAIVGNVGYDRMNLSHFTGTEIWHTGSQNRKESYLPTGWIGRYLQGVYPEFPDMLPDHPPAIEISPSTSSLFTVVGASIGMSLTDPQEFYDLVAAGPTVDDEVDVTTLAGREWEFIDRVNQQSVTFADGVREASNKGDNLVEYPETDFAAALAIVARLVAGGLATRIYKVSLGGFDTHGNQAATHANLLKTLSDGIAAFQQDITALGVDERVIGMTYSEFGRRVDDNGPGTDHGTAAPHFVFGTPISGGRMIGDGPDLTNLDGNNNLVHSIDFSCYYASVIAPYFGVAAEPLDEILPYDLCDPGDYLDLFETSDVREGRSVVEQMDLR